MTNQGILNRQRHLIQRLTLVLESEDLHVELFETHISWVLVTGKFAYKFKKAVQFDFLDFSTLDARYFYCQEELRLNRRLAPNLYLGLVSSKAAALCELQPVAFVDDFVPYLRGIPDDIHAALVLREPNGSLNTGDDLAWAHSRHADLASFTTWWLSR